MGSVESKSVASPDTVNDRTVEPTQVKEEAGDLIEIFRGIYQHWAIYVGRGYIIHIVVPSEHAHTSSGVVSGNNVKAIVKKEKLWDVVRDDRYSINNLLDNKYEPHPDWEILQEAHSRLGQELPYSLLTSNCEHFVTDLRYGKAESRQVAQKVKRAGVGLGGLVAVGALVSV